MGVREGGWVGVGDWLHGWVSGEGWSRVVAGRRPTEPWPGVVAVARGGRASLVAGGQGEG